MCHVDYSQDWKKSLRYTFKPKQSFSKIEKQRKRHSRKNSDFSEMTNKEVFEITHCKAKSTYSNKEDALVAAYNASRLIGACRVYKCDMCGKYHLTTQVPAIK